MSQHQFSKDSQRTHATKEQASVQHVQKKAKSPVQARASKRSQSLELVQQMAGSEGLGGDIHDIAASGFSDSGSSLPHGGAIQQSFGKHDVSSVQAHVGGSAKVASDQMGAQAYASGNQIAFRDSPDLHTAAHEAAHVVQQRSGVSLSGGVGQVGDVYEQHADAVADAVVQGKSAEDLLDAHASGGASGVQAMMTQKKSAVQLMGAPEATTPEVDIDLSDEAQVRALAQDKAKAQQIWANLDPATKAKLEQEAGDEIAALQQKRRPGATPSLLQLIQFKADHLPGRMLQLKNDVQASGKGSTKEGGGEEVSDLDQLKLHIGSGGNEAWNFLVEKNDISLWEGLASGERQSMSGTLSHNLVKDNLSLLKSMFEKTPDGELTTLTKLFEARFNVDVGHAQSSTKTGTDFDAVGLRRCWEVLEPLPANHVEGNAWLEHWTRYTGGGSGSGYYSRGRKESAVAYDPDKINNENGAADPGDPLYRVIRFNKVVRHEIGHAVDPKVNGSSTMCAMDKNGAWENHGTPNTALATKLVNEADGDIKGWDNASEKTKIIAALVDAMKGEDLNAKLDDAGFDSAAKTKINGDAAAKTARTCGPGKSPWYKLDDGGVDIGGRHYQVSYGTTWVSYLKAARDKKVSTYQWRAPGEWFAEVYATYYEPDGDGNPGTILDGTDPDAKQWFDDNVHEA